MKLTCTSIFFFFFDEQKKKVGKTNVAILSGRDHSSTLPAESGALLGCKGTTVSHSFPAPRGIH